MEQQQQQEQQEMQSQDQQEQQEPPPPPSPPASPQRVPSPPLSTTAPSPRLEEGEVLELPGAEAEGDGNTEVSMNIAPEAPAVQTSENGYGTAQASTNEDRNGHANDHKNENGSGHASGHVESMLGKRAWGSRDEEAFEIITQIGQGTFGQVFKAKDKRDGSLVALKKINMEKEHEGFPITAIREIKILKNLKHPNIVNLREVIVSSRDRPDEGNIYMVFEYVDYDLTGLMSSPGIVLSELHIKTYMLQLLTGTMVMHKNHIIHRDIKGPNLLITKEGCLKIADWGLARSFYTNEVRYTNRVITLWYRPPELLLGTEYYGPAVDLWSIGCLFAEMKVRRAILPGESDINQLELIYKLCGTPNDERWPAARNLPRWEEMQLAQTFEPTIDQRFAEFNGTALNLLKALLEMDPTKRITAEEALNHDYFWTEPLPIRDPKDLHLLPRFNLEAAHEWATKKRIDEREQAEREARGGGGGGHGPSRGGDRRPSDTHGRHGPRSHGGFRGRGRGPPPPFRSGHGRGGGSWGRGPPPFRR